MCFIDFEYNNQKLSDYGCIVCKITSGTGVNTLSMGNNVVFNTIQKRNKFKKTSYKYESPYSNDIIEICKNPSSSNSTFSLNEVAALMRWLNQKEYSEFRMIYENGEHSNVHYMAYFNVEVITLAGDIIGLNLKMETNAPFGYYDEVHCDMDFSTGTESISIYDLSDEIGFIYPSDVVIECLKDGDLTIHNSQDGLRNTVINNCVVGEILTLDGENKIITSSKAHVKLYNDFNYNFIKVSNKNENTINDIRNTFTVSIPCKISFTYSPIAKVGIVV